MRPKAEDVIFWLLNGNPAIILLKGDKAYNQWAKKLSSFALADGLDPLQESLNAIANDAFVTLKPLRHLELNIAKTIAPEVYLCASDLAERNLPQNPYAAFVLSLATFVGWVSCFGDRLYDRPILGTSSYLCWRQIPYVCAKTSLAVGALNGAERAIELGYDMLMLAATKIWWTDELRLDINRYRQLSANHNDRLENAIRNLADDLQKSCLPGNANFRAEVGALFWSLGLIPQSNLLKLTAKLDFVPSKRQCISIVHLSLDRIPRDPLIQAVWLEMKDKEPFNLREHDLLFGKINLDYPQFDNFLGPLCDLFIEPREIYRTYAKTLISWFRGTLHEEELEYYLNICHTMAKMPSVIDWDAILYRFANLGHLLALQAGVLSLREGGIELWQYQSQGSTSLLQRLTHYPELPDLHNILDLPILQLIELQNSNSEFTNLEAIFQVIEKYRSAALEYWLTVAQPIADDPQLAPLLEREQTLLDALRGAYFLMLYPLLPRYFDYYDLFDENYWRVHENPEKYALEPNNGRKQYHQIKEELRVVWKEIEAIDPKYARKRLNPTADWNDVIKAIGDHARPQV